LRRRSPFHTLDQLVSNSAGLGSNQVNGGQRQLLAPSFMAHIGFGPAGGDRWTFRALSPKVTVFAASLWFPTEDNRPFLLQFQFFGHTGLFVDPTDELDARGCWWALLSENIYEVSGEGVPW
jgi:hypothetical protein